MKKIMFFRPLYYMGGTEIAILNLIKKLTYFEIYVGYSDETSDDELLNRFKEYATVININEIDEFEIDVLINCSAHYHLVESLKRIKRKKTILWLHHLINLEKSVLTIKEEYNKLDSIISVSNTITKKLKKMFSKLSRKIHTAYNIIDEDEIKKLSNLHMDLNLSKTLNLVTVSRVCKSKGFDRMLSLADELKNANVDFKWFIVGDNYYKNEFNQIIRKYKKYKNYFEWFGFLDNPHNIVKQCDYSVLLSDDETWGLVLTEAMILGVPCISTDFDVAYEQIKDGKNGIILSRENLESYKDRIIDIVSNKKKYKKSVSSFSYKNDFILKKWIKLLEGKTFNTIN